MTCTLCTYCPQHVGTCAHIIVRHPDCRMSDAAHEPGVAAGCTCLKNEPPPPDWIHTAGCPAHP